MRAGTWPLAIAAAVLPAILLAGCKREPSFDERFGKAEAQIKRKAAQIDADLAAREKAADALTMPPPPTTTPARTGT
jgi:outer membrane murein-binding lipoprotein Lpp